MGATADEIVALDDVANGRLLWALNDRQNSVLAWYGPLPDEGMGIVRQFTYGAFGSFTVDDPNDVGVDYISDNSGFYTGREYDPETGFYYYRSRYYDPVTVVFVSPDSIGFASGTTNHYAYAHNSPVNFNDPSGNIAIYTGLAGINAAVETVVEYAFTWWMGTDQDLEDFAWGATFGKNFGINFATAGLGNKLKWAGVVGRWFVRQGIEIAGDTTFDVYYRGDDFGAALARNAVGSVVGEGIGKAVGFGLRTAADTAVGRVTTAYVGGFIEGALSRRSTSVFAGMGLGGAGDLLTNGLNAAHKRGRARFTEAVSASEKGVLPDWLKKRFAKGEEFNQANPLDTRSTKLK